MGELDSSHAAYVAKECSSNHHNPLLTFSTYSRGEEIHCAAWPLVAPHPRGPAPFSMSDEGGCFDSYSPCFAADIIITAVAEISRVYAIQASCFVLHSTGIVTEKGVNKLGTGQSIVFNSPGGGNAKIFGPDGRQLTEDLPITEEGMVFADLEMDLIIKEKAVLDNCGHASRPELVWLGRDTSERNVVRVVHSSEPKEEPRESGPLVD